MTFIAPLPNWVICGAEIGGHNYSPGHCTDISHECRTDMLIGPTSIIDLLNSITQLPFTVFTSVHLSKLANQHSLGSHHHKTNQHLVVQQVLSMQDGIM